MEDKAKKSEDNENSSENGGDKAKVWLQENLRMLISVAIVVVIAGGIYSYSKRTQPVTSQNPSEVTEQGGEGKISVIGGDSDNADNAADSQDNETTKPAETQNVTAPETPAVNSAASQETESSFVETASKGDSTTKLARRALANYLEKNPDSSLTAEHKIFIEDMLRRQVKDGHLGIGESREFSKNAIANAVEKSKSLTENQLKNLTKYANRVPDLK